MTTATETIQKITAKSPTETFELGRAFGRRLRGGESVLLTGGLGAGKTVLTKGILAGLGYDPDDVTSPSFTLVNLYRARLDVYHIDLWRLDENTDPVSAVGLDEILSEREAVVVIEWAEKLGLDLVVPNAIRISINGDGDEPREITVESAVEIISLS
jgi:tRNA threonylcarbamoyladenosine biosynthesis protein TsaE